MTAETNSMGFFNDYARKHNQMHPIAKLFSSAIDECEKLPASDQQTKTVISIGKCRDAVEKHFQELTMQLEEVIEDSVCDYLSDTNGEVEQGSLVYNISERIKAKLINQP